MHFGPEWMYEQNSQMENKREIKQQPTSKVTLEVTLYVQLVFMIFRYKAVSPSKPSKLNLVLTSQVHGKKADSWILNVFKNEEQHFIHCFFFFFLDKYLLIIQSFWSLVR